MEFQPLYDRLLVRRCEAEAYPGMIVIPDSAKEKPMEGLVLAVGAGRYNDAGNLMPMSVKVRDRILLGKYAGTDIKIEGQELLILREDEVLGIVKGGPAEQPKDIQAAVEIGRSIVAELKVTRAGPVSPGQEDCSTQPPLSGPREVLPVEKPEDFLAALKELAKP